MRPIQTYVEGLSPTTLQGCIRIMNGTGTGGRKSSLTSTLVRGYPQQTGKAYPLTEEMPQPQ